MILKRKESTMPTATVTSKGQITLPIELRKKLGLKAGTKVDFFENEQGQYVLYPKTGSVKEMKGLLRRLGYIPPAHPVTIEQMDRDILDAVAEDYLRSIGEPATSERKDKIA
jgi:antitoxin PrlF